MPGIVVQYERFVEVRQRRRRVVEEMARQTGSMSNEDARDTAPVTIDCEAVIDKQCGTVAQTAVAVRPKNPPA